METATADYNQLLETSSRIKAEREKQIAELRSQLATERADREEVEAQLADREAKLAELRSELSDLKQKSATANQDSPETVNLTEKAGELLNLFKSLLPPKAKLPNGTISKIEKILEARQDEQN